MRLTGHGWFRVPGHTLGEVFADTVKPMHPAWEKVTLRQVLAHRAGATPENREAGSFAPASKPSGHQIRLFQ
jgi:CubicO group peptidase (beta-lactamase class C family)